ncbi:hypothetical protein IPA_09325 [Ignicoccus pacificus DSM 13166]|uniref:Uncharacterized protein n=1 Tax=Ignicoccus pacificus DSM 13166 TaxID=940294 RepID=A0A977KC24_9CREN|nr:hypothetical protein IPA_09325 [Ignicoccus pacificus DSM 13166]
MVYGGVSVPLPMSVCCLCKNVVGVSDGEHTYFYKIVLGKLEPIDVKVYGVASKCSYSGRFLGVVAPGAVYIFDLYNNLMYTFSNAIDVSTYRNSFAIGFLKEVEVWKEGALFKYPLKGSLVSMLLSDKVYVCEGNKVEMLGGPSINIRCQWLSLLDDKVIDVYGNQYVVLSTKLKLLGKGTLKCEAYSIDFSDSKLMIRSPNEICLYKLVEVKEFETLMIMSTIALFGTIISILNKILRERLTPEPY